MQILVDLVVGEGRGKGDRDWTGVGRPTCWVALRGDGSPCAEVGPPSPHLERLPCRKHIHGLPVRYFLFLFIYLFFIFFYDSSYRFFPMPLVEKG